MQRRGCISGLGCLFVLLFLGLLAGITWFQGGPLLASPGPLSTVAPRATPLQGFRSHADFENECGRCHAPFWGRERMADRCMACHTTVAEDLRTRSGLHGRLRDPQNCKVCHPEHRGRDAQLTRLNVAEFPHTVETVGFTLAEHHKDFDGTPLDCRSCHLKAYRSFDQTVCIECHVRGRAAFMEQHRADVGDDCLACHDGSGKVANFDHDRMTDFPLLGEHREAKCRDCHTGKRFRGLDTACVSCHRKDDKHKGRFGTECEACHTPTKWDKVTFDHARTKFPLTGKHAGLECEDCHAKQRFAGTPTDCVACHPEPEVHAGLLGTQCAKCHNVNAWSPAQLPEHTFPINHRSRKSIACDVCHDQGTFKTYTCYNCHEHNPAKIRRKHLKEGIRDFQDCVRCHPTGREHEAEGGKHEED